MMTTILDTLRLQVQTAHEIHPQLRAFVAFPDDLTTGNYRRRTHGAEAKMSAEIWDGGGQLDALRDALIGAAGLAQWRLTYEGSKIDPDFMERFGCYCIIGDGGFWRSHQMSGYVVYMPAGLHYPWHHHPAEEIYLVLAGSARFMRQGSADRILGPGATSFHAGNQPHAMETTDHPVMALVLWRNGFESPPVLTDGIDPAG